MDTENQKWNEIEHDADIGLYASGSDLCELFRNAAEGLINLITNPCTTARSEQRSVEVNQNDADHEMLLVEWLEEILWLWEVELFVPSAVVDFNWENEKICATILGERYNVGKHESRHSIKAVTWHDLEIKHEQGKFNVTLILDV